MSTSFSERMSIINLCRLLRMYVCMYSYVFDTLMLKHVLVHIEHSIGWYFEFYSCSILVSGFTTVCTRKDTRVLINSTLDLEIK